MMLTQKNSSNLSNGNLLANYFDFVEETPNDIQKYLSKCREIDYKTTSITSEIEKLSDQIITSSADKKARLKTRLHSVLVKLMELKDEKIHLSQMLSASIESSYKSVVDSLQCNNLHKIERSPSPSVKSITSVPNNFAISIVKPPSTSNASSETNSASESQDKGTKRARKTRIENLELLDDDDDPLPSVSVSKPSSQTLQVITSIVNKRTTNANTANKKAKKRKATKKQATAQIPQETIDEVILDDPDETTYCICQQISYGEMVCCENDACPIEWFHFSCVELVSKPKGRWFCPQCRGDKPSVMNKNLRKKQQEANLM